MNHLYSFTIFTPTYNRGYKLTYLYESLCLQTFTDFEWIVVDDGSTDNTSELIIKFQKEGKIKISYQKQVNQGKHIAINHGVQLAKGALFFIVDSDDVLPFNSLEILNREFNLVESNADCAGISGRVADHFGRVIGTGFLEKNIFCSSLDLRFQMKVKGDMSEVIKTSVIKQFPFPRFEDERFCPEALIWNRIAQKYKLLWINEITYVAEYLPDGLTSKIFKIRKDSPKASCLYYAELSKSKIPFFGKVKAVANFWRFAIYLKTDLLQSLREVSVLLTIIALPISIILALKDKRS